MFIELIESTLTKYQWRRSKYRHESRKVLEVLLPPCHRKGHHGIIFNEAAEAKMLLSMAGNLPNKANPPDPQPVAKIKCGLCGGHHFAFECPDNQSGG